MRGIGRRRLTIALGFAMAALARLHSLAVPLLHGLWFDGMIRQGLGRMPATG
jgi:hypothetical protein